jgi:probable DNA metabolism protein
MHIALEGPTDVFGFRSNANSLLAHQVPPADIEWEAQVSTGQGEAMGRAAGRPMSLPSALHAIVPRSFVRLTELVVLHRDPVRFDLLYRLLWRLVHEPELAASRDDADMAAAQSMAHAVRRDIFKTRQALRLRPLVLAEGVPVMDFGWCEPRHHVSEAIAESLTTLHDRVPWLLATPDRCAVWDGEHLLCGPGLTTVEAAALDDSQWMEFARLLAEPRSSSVAAIQPGH